MSLTMTGTVTQIDQQDFKREVLDASTPVLVDFWADWCQPCHMLAPTVEQLAEEYVDRIKVAKVDLDTNADLAHTYSISSIPTILVFKDGQVSERIVGVQPKSEYAAALDALLN